MSILVINLSESQISEKCRHQQQCSTYFEKGNVKGLIIGLSTTMPDVIPSNGHMDFSCGMGGAMVKNITLRLLWLENTLGWMGLKGHIAG